MIAAVAGPAVGIGTTLLLHCDLVYAGDNAAFSLPFVNLGLCPEAGSALLLPSLVGYPRAAEKLMLGEAFYAEEAVEMGLINRILPPQEVNAYAQAQAAKLAAKPLAALRATKAVMKMGQVGLKAIMDEELKLFGALDGKGNLIASTSSRGFVLTACVMGAVCIAGCLVHYFTTKERVKPIGDDDEKLSAKTVFTMLFKCKSWVLNMFYIICYGVIKIGRAHV